MQSILAHAAIYLSLTVFAGLVLIDALGAYGGKQGIARPKKGYSPKALVMVPCKGADIGLEKNLASIKAQRYGDFDVVAITDDRKDISISAIRSAGIRHMVSEGATRGCSGKVSAVGTAITKNPGYEVYVIADSDIRVTRDWLSTVVAPLSEDGVGLSTMYPYFMHVGGFWSEVKSVWGAVGEGLMKRESSRFGWGGSLAFRRSLLDGKSLRFLLGSRYSVSDDVCLTMIAKGKGLGIAYTDSAQPVVRTDDDASGFWEWANRQTALSIMGNRNNLYIGMPFYVGECLCIISGIALSLLVSPAFVLLLSHTLRNAMLARKRSRQKGLAVIPISFMLPFLYVCNLSAAASMKGIRWRGRTYALPS